MATASRRVNRKRRTPRHVTAVSPVGDASMKRCGKELVHAPVTMSARTHL